MGNNCWKRRRDPRDPFFLDLSFWKQPFTRAPFSLNSFLLYKVLNYFWSCFKRLRDVLSKLVKPLKIPCWLEHFELQTEEAEVSTHIDSATKVTHRGEERDMMWKGGQTRFPLWADRAVRVRPLLKRPRSEQQSPCNQRTWAGGREAPTWFHLQGTSYCKFTQNRLLQQNRSWACTYGGGRKKNDQKETKTELLIDKPTTWDGIRTSESTHRQT